MLKQSLGWQDVKLTLLFLHRGVHQGWQKVVHIDMIRFKFGFELVS